MNIEERDRYRPLLCIKRELNEFIVDAEKIEKRDMIALKREQESLVQFIEKQNSDIKQVKIMIQQTRSGD